MTTKLHTGYSSLHAKIYEKARVLFYKNGVRNTTMDDLARELGISKKTLYKVFPNKADLVHFCVAMDLKEDEREIHAISEKTDNAIEELLQIGLHIQEELKIFHPAIINDLMKFFPESWKLVENHRDIFAHKNIARNIKKGIKQGYFRKEISIEITTLIQLQLSFLPLQPIQSEHKPTDIHLEVLKYNIYAIATPAGIELFQKLIKKMKL